MITRAQAEALLTLAESLEACERLGILVSQGPLGEFELYFADTRKDFASLPSLSGEEIRHAVNALLPDSEK